ncbi:MAG: hypothetical protein QM817_03465 [Archangium sp.]
MRTLPLLLVVAASSGCPQESEYVEPPPTPLDFALFPTVVGNSKLFAEVSEARLEFDPTTKDAISALGMCVDAAAYCYTPGSKELSWCLEHTRTCATQTPWMEKPCCPQACKDEFSAKVAAGVSQSDALEQVFFQKKTCFPGVVEALEGTP